MILFCLPKMERLKNLYRYGMRGVRNGTGLIGEVRSNKSFSFLPVLSQPSLALKVRCLSLFTFGKI
ncbi:MAG: hypothetical protein DMG88_23425 [Acidobacteria bacterium]|nr:MAG: hypothetical protein DMG88_23425 [Acidobacteriota bacterium]